MSEKSDQADLADALELFTVALQAAGGATLGLYVQTARSAAMGMPRGVMYRLARKNDDGVITYPLGIYTRRASRLVEDLNTARAVLAMVPDCELPL